MSTSEASSSWDFTPVIDLLHSFRVDTRPDASSPAVTGKPVPSNDVVCPSAGNNLSNVDDCRKLGDFTAVWNYLGQPSLPQEDEVTSRKEVRVEVLDNNLTLKENTDETCNTGLQDSGEPRTPQIKKILLRKTKRSDEGKAPVDKPIVPSPPKVLLTRPSNSPDNGPITGCDPVSRQKNASNEITPPTSPSIPRNRLKTPLGKPRNKVEPLFAGSAEEKKLELILRLRERCPNERKVLIHPELSDPAFAQTNTSSRGIHVFVDASNIMVGFHDRIKTARNIPISTRVPRLPLSFHNLSLILERGRPICKRVLVGSDRFPAIDEAELLGYEINILDRVRKTKDTPRKKKFANGDCTNGGKSVGSKVQDQSSGSETNVEPQLQRWVEQAVDEILHLKMLESIVDATEPSTIVLATGDAAEAEYSDGFMRMVERALEKGWRVELISFNSTTSRAYRRKDFRTKWSSRFSIIQLDAYAEYLLAM